MKKLGIVKSFLFRKPIYADLVVTERCNMKCQMCDYWQRKPGWEMSLKDYYSVSEKLNKLGVRILSITGGEPLLAKEIIEIIRLFSKDFFVVLNTNGTLINEKLADKLINSGIFSISISLDSLTEKHNLQRGMPQALNKAIKAVNLLKDSKINLAIKVVLTKLNEDEIEDLIEFSKKNKIKIGFNFYTQMMSGEKPKMDLTDPEATIRKILLLKKKNKKIVLSTYYYLIKALDYYKKKAPPCQAGLSYFTVLPNGDIIRCAKLKKEVFANISNDYIDKIKQKLKLVRPTKCNNCWVSCRGEVDSLRIDFFNKTMSYLINR